MKKIVLITAMFLLTLTAATAQIPSEVQASVDKMTYNAMMARSDGDLKKAEIITLQAINIVDMQIEGEDSADLKMGLYYDLARYYALQNKNKEAVDAFYKAVENGWCDYQFTVNDGDLSSLKRNKQFNSLMDDMKSNGQMLTAR